MELVLRRRGLWPGRIVIDDAGVTREGVREHVHLAWDAIDRYRLAIELVAKDPQRAMIEPRIAGLHVLEEIVRGTEDERLYRLGLELEAGASRLAIDGHFHDDTLGIAHVLHRLHPPALARARAAGTIVAGPIAVTATAVRWEGLAPLARADVEAIELFDDVPVTLRVLARGKVWAYAKARTADIPNVLAVLALAGELGYRIRGLELLESLTVAPPVARLA
jgi:hypothetical protein